jgi:hypothetical protein
VRSFCGRDGTFLAAARKKVRGRMQAGVGRGWSVDHTETAVQPLDDMMTGLLESRVRLRRWQRRMVGRMLTAQLRSHDSALR